VALEPIHWSEVRFMSRSRRRSKGSSSDRGSVVASPATAESSATRPLRKWGLPAVIGMTVVVVVGSYFWLHFEPPPLNPLERQSAADIYRTALSVDPENHEAHYNLGLELQSQGKLDEAISHYRRAIEISGKDGGYHNNLGAALAALGKLDQAVDHFNKAITFDPNNAEARFNLGNALFYQEELESAIGHYRRAIELKPDYAGAHNNLAVALKQTGHLQEATQHRLEAMRLERAQQGAGSQDSVRSE